VARLAERLGVSDRHLRRMFEAALGLSPLQYLQTRRLLTAKQLLTDTPMPVTQVALASGFAQRAPLQCCVCAALWAQPDRAAPQRHPGRGRAGGHAAPGLSATAGCAGLAGLFCPRQFHGVEWAGDAATPALRRTVRLQTRGAGGLQDHCGWLNAHFDPDRHQVLVQTSDSLYPVLPLVMRRVRAMLDLDADPAAINAVLHASFPEGDGLRVPGAFDGFELAVRAVLGQQITVAAARTLGQRLVERFGEPIATPWPELTRLFPLPAVLAQAPGEALGQLGIVRQRQAAIVALARAVDGGQLQLHGLAPTWPPPRRRCAHCPALATGRRSTSPCACCAGPMPFRRATWRCKNPWACRPQKPGTRGHPGLAGLATLAQLCRGARMGGGQHREQPQCDSAGINIKIIAVCAYP
jgi:AraC family transcriptional regulator of adaptative response / DNA-3-methyladenine glycosylase II